ncbi:MAG: hypothetical protein ACRD0K_14580 [Egibacteraceae bacterium]
MAFIAATDIWQSALPDVVPGGGAGGTLLGTDDLAARGVRTPVGGTDCVVREPGGEAPWRLDLAARLTGGTAPPDPLLTGGTPPAGLRLRQTSPQRRRFAAESQRQQPGSARCG